MNAVASPMMTAPTMLPTILVKTVPSAMSTMAVTDKITPGIMGHAGPKIGSRGLSRSDCQF